MTQPTPDQQPGGQEIPVELELRARLNESQSLLAAARERAVFDQIRMHQLTEQLAERDDAYTQLAALLEQQTGAEETKA